VIGVIVGAGELEVAREFFELFKTAWEPAVPARKYPVVLTTAGCPREFDADLFLVYGSRVEAVDVETGIQMIEVDGPADVTWRERSFPLYGRVARFAGGDSPPALASDRGPVDCRRHVGRRLIHRIGYDLFAEVRHLLSEGQPAARALTPTLDLHIGVLRSILAESGVSFTEIPPRPHGYDFVCCLTHDIDFCEIRRHKADRTLAGFALRASVGSMMDLVRGRRTFAEAARNWVALASLPLVHLGAAPDFWRPFDDYARVESSQSSTFFVVPFKGRPGIDADGAFSPRRAVQYQASEIRGDLAGVVSRGSEVALHGIDAWLDAEAGRKERAEIASAAGGHSAGVRMHWLYFGPDSPAQLESAGFDYDSTWGYNETVGYRAGTSQVFRFSGCRHLLELPMSIMDSALFFPGRMGLSHEEALPLCRRIVANAKQLGGTLVLNWHDRSLAPERLWSRPYIELLHEIGREGRAWFSRATDAVDWFRWRRSIRFAAETGDPASMTVTAPIRRSPLPAAVLRTCRRGVVEEHPFDGRALVRLEA
jgi:hypothetical protein